MHTQLLPLYKYFTLSSGQSNLRSLLQPRSPPKKHVYGCMASDATVLSILALGLVNTSNKDTLYAAVIYITACKDTRAGMVVFSVL